MQNPIHLHVHSDGSILDGICNIDLLLDKVEEQGNKSIAITDHGNMIKLFEFYQSAKKRGIKPILGCEFYVSDNEKGSSHIILLAKNKKGFENLLMLKYISNDNFYYKPRVKFSDLEKHKDGVICLSACIGNEIAKALTKGEDKAIEVLKKYKKLYANDFFLEIQSNTLVEQKKYNLFIEKISAICSTSVVVTCDAHYVNKEDFFTHDTALCIGVNKKKNDIKRFKFPSNDFYLQNSDEMLDKLTYLDENFLKKCILNTHLVANSVDFEFDLETIHAPSFTTLEDEKILLAKKCNIGFKKRLEEGKIENKAEAVKRISFELNVICSKGYAGYFLIVDDYLNYCRLNNIPTGPGRGSVCGSMIAFILGITEVNPLKYNLLFERFLNPTRNSFPDIDSDFCYEQRDKVIDYIENKYGYDNVCNIMAEGKMTLKAVTRRVLSAYGYEMRVINKISKLMDGYKTVQEALEDNEISSRIGEQERKDIALLENSLSHTSTHAAGIVICPEPVRKFLPLSKDRDTGKYCSEWHKKHIESLNLIKFDILGLKQLTIFSKSIKYLSDFQFNKLYNIDFESEAIYEVLKKVEILQTIFQFAGGTAGQVINDMKPDCFEDIMVAESICRPGVKEANLYLKNKKEFMQTGDFFKPHYWQYVQEILEPTYGAIVYQEQTMLLMNKITGGKWDLGKCDSMRKVKDLEEYREDFLNSSVIPRDIANEIFDRFSLEYSFNKSHACAYAMLSAQCAYMLHHHPKEFLAGCMTIELTQAEPNLQGLIKIAKSLNIDVLPPDINISNNEFIPVENGIRMPITMIAYVGENATKSIIENRPYNDFSDFISKVPGKTVNKRTISMLIKAGAFDCFNSNRSIMLENFYEMKKEKVDVLYWCDEAQICFEIEAFGFAFSKHPLDRYINKNINEFEDGNISIIAIINELSPHRDRNGNEMCFLKLENKECSFEGVCFSETFKRFKDKLVPLLPIIIDGKKQGNSVIINKVIRA
ncbi:MAG: DNA polymerase III subunit alpha [Clostridium sp.]